jgi:hypothetical protein
MPNFDPFSAVDCRMSARAHHLMFHLGDIFAFGDNGQIYIIELADQFSHVSLPLVAYRGHRLMTPVAAR